MNPSKTEAVANGVASGIEPLVVNAREARRMLGGVSYTTLWRLMRAGHIRPLPGVRMKLFSIRALRRFVEQQERRAA